MRIASNGLQEKQRKHSEADFVIITRYGDGKKFAETFNPDLQRACAENIERSFSGDAPTIASLRNAYPTEQVRVWILAQLENLNIYAGTKNKMNPDQMMMLSDVIMTEYFYLKASELLLFFYQFKAGKYGELYGSVDPLRVSSALIEFAAYRRDMIFRIEQKQMEVQRLSYESMRNATTWHHYLKLKFKRSKRQWRLKNGGVVFRNNGA